MEQPNVSGTASVCVSPAEGPPSGLQPASPLTCPPARLTWVAVNRDPSQNGARGFTPSLGFWKELPTPNVSDTEAWMPSEDIKGIMFIFESEMEVLLPAGFQVFERQRGKPSRLGIPFQANKQDGHMFNCLWEEGPPRETQHCRVLTKVRTTAVNIKSLSLGPGWTTD